MFKSRDVCPVGKKKVWHVSTNHPPSCFYVLRCHSPLQIKHSCFGGNYGVSLCLISGGWSSNLISLGYLYCEILSLLPFCILLFFFPPQIQLWQRDTSIWFLHIMVFVFKRSMRLFLAKRQLHKMMLRTMGRLGGIGFLLFLTAVLQFSNCT